MGRGILQFNAQLGPNSFQQSSHSKITAFLEVSWKSQLFGDFLAVLSVCGKFLVDHRRF